jgi:hypothetical protein
MSAGHYGKHVLALILVATGYLIARGRMKRCDGTDETLEAWLLDRSPDWLNHLTTPF